MRINVTAVPNARSPSVERISESEYRVRIDAKAAEGKANERLRELLADYFNVRKSDVTIVHGSKSRKKAVEVAVR